MKLPIRSISPLSIVLISIGCILMHSGCAARRQAVVPEPVTTPLPRPYSMAAMLEMVDASNAYYRTFKADAKLTLETAGSIQHSQFECRSKMAIALPDKLRMNGYTTFGGKLFDLIATGEQNFLYLPKEGTVYVSLPDTNPVAFTSPFVPSSENILRAFVSSSLAELTQNKTCYYEYYGDFFIIYILRGSQNDAGMQLDEKIWVSNPDFHIVRRELIAPNGVIRFSVDIDDFLISEDGKLFPKSIHITDHLNSLRATLVITSMMSNPDLSEQIFDFVKPKNVKEVIVE